MSRKEEKQVQDSLQQMEERDEERRQEDLVRQNKMGTMPVGKLLVNVSVPIVISMLVQAMYNVVDSIFVARLGEEALAAVGFVFPVQNLMIAVAVGTAVGINSRLGRRLGEQNIESANRVAVNGLFLTLLSWMAFAVLGLVASHAFMGASAGASPENADMVAMGTGYMQIVTIGSAGVFFSVTLERFLQATGRSMYSMVSQLSGAITNIILDPIMIFGLLGFPAMGVAGAALATVIGQWVGMLVSIWCNKYRNPELHIKLRGFRPSAKTIKHIYQVGLPSIVMQSIGSVMTHGMNMILVGFGTTAVSAFSVYFKLQSFVLMPVFGFNSGMIPVVAFNYGARNKQRIQKTIQICCVVNFCITLAGTLLFWLVPEWLLALFDAKESMVAVGTVMLRVISLSFPLAAISIVFSGMYQAVGLGLYSLVTSVVRQLVVLLPVAWLLAAWHGLAAIWWAFPAAEVVCLAMAVLLFRQAWKQKIEPLDRPLPQRPA